MSGHLRVLLALITSGVTLLLPLAGMAEVHVKLQRLNDTDALLFATGTLSAPVPAGNPHIMFRSSSRSSDEVKSSRLRSDDHDAD